MKGEKYKINNVASLAPAFNFMYVFGLPKIYNISHVLVDLKSISGDLIG